GRGQVEGGGGGIGPPRKEVRGKMVKAVRTERRLDPAVSAERDRVGDRGDLGDHPLAVERRLERDVTRIGGGEVLREDERIEARVQHPQALASVDHQARAVQPAQGVTGSRSGQPQNRCSVGGGDHRYAEALQPGECFRGVHRASSRWATTEAWRASQAEASPYSATAGGARKATTCALKSAYEISIVRSIAGGISWRTGFRTAASEPPREKRTARSKTSRAWTAVRPISAPIFWRMASGSG